MSICGFKQLYQVTFSEHKLTNSLSGICLMHIYQAWLTSAALLCENLPQHSEFQEMERSNAWKCIYIQKPALPIFSRVKTEKNRHPVVVFLIINDSPASSNFEKQTRKTLASPDSLSPSQSFSVSVSLRMFKLSGEYDLTVTSLNESNHILFYKRITNLSQLTGRTRRIMPPEYNQYVIITYPPLMYARSYYLAAAQMHKTEQSKHTHKHSCSCI